ncbi:MAG TPA: RHS repeat-associated core domain-containing protein [Candidatus Babeliaceae bacterium]|nr:RHS repeat-associated core domain-containing protein [Candidatus Babeliaceae bacterium]
MELERQFKYNGKELNHQEFSDGNGLEWYSYGDREFDPQLGTFHAVDPYAGNVPDISPYSYALNNPALLIDINGDSTVPKNDVDWESFDTQNNTVGLDGIDVLEGFDFSSLLYGGNGPLYTGAIVQPTKFVKTQSGSSSLKIKNNPSNISFLIPVVNNLEQIGRHMEEGEIMAKYTNEMMKANSLKQISLRGLKITSEGLEALEKFFGRTGTITGALSIGLNGLLYAHGDIDGKEFYTSSGITATAIIASLAVGPEAGIAVEMGAWVTPKVYNGVKSSLQQASEGITNWSRAFQNSAASTIINH